jgi:phage portal protein BeeE
MSRFAIKQRIENSVKAARSAAWSFSRGNGWGSYQGTFGYGNNGFGLGYGGVNYEQEVGDVWRHNSVFSVISWLRRNFPEAPIGVSPVSEDTVDHSHAFANLIRRPNPSYSRTTLWAGTVLSYVARGDAYWFKRRNGIGEVVEYWYRPHWLVRPVRDLGSTNFIDYYQYWNNNQWERVEKSEVVHLRNGIDPDNEMHGLSDLAKLFRTVFTDNEADAFCASMLMNMGVPGVILRHGTQRTQDNPIDPLVKADADYIAAKFEAKTSGHNRARAFVLDGDWQVDFPKIMMDSTFVEKVKRISQADICAAVGLPAVVVGFEVGLQHASAKASHAESWQQAYAGCLIPMQTSIAEDLTLAALPDFEKDPTIEVAFDYSKVSALVENGDAKASRFQKLADAASKLEAAGWDPDEILAALELPKIAYNKPMAQDTTTGTQGVTGQTNQTTTTDQSATSQDGNGNLVQVAGDGNGVNGAGNKHAGGVAGKHIALKAIRPGEPTNDEIDDMIRARRRLAQERAAGQ